MRRITLRLIIVVATFTIGVGVTSFFIYRSELPKPQTEAQQPINSDPVILNIIAQDSSVAGNTGEYLRLRVYATGRIETDVTGYNTITRETGSLEAGELNKLIELLSQPDLWAAKEKYPQFAIYKDTSSEQTVTFARGDNEKKISLINPSAIDPGNIKNYPPSLIKLLALVEQIQSRFYKPIK